MEYGWISLTTDYGTDDGYVAACKGVIGRIAPSVRTIDITHHVPPQDVRRGAAVLAQTVPYLPPAVHLAVVDPGVGTARRGLAVLPAGAGVLVGPDNGLLLGAADVLGGVAAAYELTEPAYWLATVSVTFHGRDVFAPVAAHLATGVPADNLGPAVDPDTLVRLAAPETAVGAGRLATEVLSVDRFGNIQLAAGEAELAAAGLVTAGPGPTGQGPAGRVRLRLDTVTVETTLGGTFADVPLGALLVYVDSAGLVAVAVNNGSAAARLGVVPGALVSLESIG
ncbi:MAG TPA: SAM-dependent chlorinase/fluorinase [Mycobacteriales bacterium]|nr:SAM-dependent chlorinase/fluorinase [Mycobacteriales bacterium]